MNIRKQGVCDAAAISVPRLWFSGLHGSTIHLLTGHVRCSICGNRMVGSCLNHKYRYYHCRGAYPTSVRGAVCKAGYVRAEEMEEKAWNKVKEVIEHPKMILAELKKRADASRSGNGRIEKEIARIQKRIATNDSQQQRILTLFGNGGIDENAVVDKLSELNKEKQQYEDQVNRLSKSIEHKIDLNAAKEKIEKYCKRVRKNLDKCTLQDKKKALNALDVQIAAIPGEMKIRIAVPLEFITIEQT